MADEPKPTLEGEAEAKPSGAENSEANVDIDAVIKELEAIGKTTPEAVRNMHTASVQTGRYANEIGELRQEIQRMRSERQTPQRQQNDDYYGNDTPIDIRAMLREEINGAITGMQRQQAELYQKQLDELNSVYGDEDYPLVQEAWETYTRTPNFNMKMQSGQASYRTEYDKFVRSYYRKVAQKSREALEFATKGGQKKKPPHMESGTPPPAREEGDNPKDKVRKIAAKTSGHDDDIDKMIETLLPEGDPIYRPD